MRAAIAGFIVSLAIAGASSSQAGSLQVAPVSIEAVAPAAAATISLRNKSTAPLNAQIRVFRWAQEGGEEKLIPSDAIVASPPMATLAARRGIYRAPRTAVKEPVQGEETLPAARRRTSCRRDGTKQIGEVRHPLFDPGIFFFQ